MNEIKIIEQPMWIVEIDRKCVVCDYPTIPVRVKERMMGTNEIFTYYQCIRCAHTYLHPVPDSMDKYYDPKEYYSFQDNDGLLADIIRNSIAWINRASLHLGIKKSPLYSASLLALLRIPGLEKNAHILDFGCGSGKLVKELKSLGFFNSKGYDYFLPAEETENGEPFLTSNIARYKDKWGVITLNHVFEHLEPPVLLLQEIMKMLRPNGKVILRFPLIDSYAYSKYQSRWVQFDAPRHINLFTRQSINDIIEQAGGIVLEAYDDSNHFQFTGSDLYMKDKTMKDNGRLKRLLSPKTYSYHFLAKRLNKQKRGDQMVIILKNKV